jgi:hypothetical protein
VKKKSDINEKTKLMDYFYFKYVDNYVKYINKKNIYYNNFLDFRGRIYYSGYFNINSSHLFRQLSIVDDSVVMMDTENLYMKLKENEKFTIIIKKTIDETISDGDD